MTDAVDQFKKNNPAWRSIRVVITDKSSAERQVFKRAFPDARMLLCQFHVINYLNKEVSGLYSNVA